MRKLINPSITKMHVEAYFIKCEVNSCATSFGHDAVEGIRELWSCSNSHNSTLKGSFL